MASSSRAYRAFILVLSTAFLLLGLGIVARTLLWGGGPLSVGVLMGIAFMAVGAGRLWITSRMGH
jgi:hypothetical protein